MEESVAQLASSVTDLTDHDAELREWCSEATLKRYLASRKGQVQPAAKKLRKTLEWRQTARPQDITFQDVKPLAATGRLEVLEFSDLEGRPVLCYRLSRQNATGLKPDEHLRFMLFNLEAASKLADANGVGKMTWLMDMDRYDSSQSVPFRTTLKIISILQEYDLPTSVNFVGHQSCVRLSRASCSHYPERLGIVLIMRANSIFQALYYILRGFLDPVTREKLIFLNEADEGKMRQSLLAYIGEKQLDAALSCRSADASFDVAAYQTRCEALRQS